MILIPLFTSCVYQKLIIVSSKPCVSACCSVAKLETNIKLFLLFKYFESKLHIIRKAWEENIYSSSKIYNTQSLYLLPSIHKISTN